MATAAHARTNGAVSRATELLESNDVEQELVDPPVLETAAKLAAVGLVHRRCQHRAEVFAVAHRLDLADDVGAHLEAAGEQLRLHHLLEGLTGFAVLLCAETTTSIRESRRDVFVRRERGFPQREHGDDTDRDTDGREQQPDQSRLHVPWPARRSSLRICSSSAPGTSWARTVTSSSSSPPRG